MNHIYSQQSTGAHFAIRTLANMRESTDFKKSHPWYTLLIITNMNGLFMVDDYKVKNFQSKAVFISPGQHFFVDENTDCKGYAISFNQEFYCIEYHDSEVSCNGLLFVNNFDLVQIDLNQQQQSIYDNTVKEMAGEFNNDDPLQGEMLKNLLKNILIRSSRLFREQHSEEVVDDENFDFVRKFSDLVEKNFRKTKQVEAYAQMMNIAPATLTKKLQKYGEESPLRTIINRVTTEAKRLLIYTNKSIKEIAHLIGYDDQYYFSRLFSKETGISPSDYKKQQVTI